MAGPGQETAGDPPPLEVEISGRVVTDLAQSTGAIERAGYPPGGNAMYFRDPDGSIYYHPPEGTPGYEGRGWPLDDEELLAAIRKDEEEEEKERPRTPDPATSNPAPPELVPDTREAIAVCLSPDVCRSPDKPVPYMAHGTADNDDNYSPDVRSNGQIVKRADSRFTTTYGDEPGVGLGVKSNTVGDVVEPVTSSRVVRANGVPVQRHADQCTLNNGNCPGEYVHVRDTRDHEPPDARDQQDRAAAPANESQTSAGPGSPDGEYGGRGAGERFADGFTNNASETGEAIKQLGSNIADGASDLASDMVTDPGGTIAAGAGNVRGAAEGAANWTGEVAGNLYDDPVGTLGRGADNVKNTASSIWTAIAVPYREAYAEGGLAGALGHGTFDGVRLGLEALVTKGAVTAAGKVVGTGAAVAGRAAKVEDVVEDAVDNAPTGPRRTRTNEEDGARSTNETPLDVPDVETPYGPAVQSNAPEALAARASVEEGATLYRVGTLGKSQGPEAQFWSLEHPSTPGYAARHGIPPENVAAANFIQTSTLKPGTSFVTRPAPAVGTNPGGGIEVVVPPGGVTMGYFHNF